MIVDAHCHIFPDSFAQRRAELATQDATFATLFSNPKSRLATTAELLQAMERDGVDQSVVMGMGWTSQDISSEVNDFLIQARQEHPHRLVGFCSVNPTWGSQAAGEIRRCVEAGLLGVGEFHPDTQGFDITSKTQMKPVMMAAYELGVPVVIHASEPVGHSYAGKGSTTPDKLYRFILNFPENDIICAHWGGGLPFYGLMPEVNRALQKVYFDTAVSPLLYQKQVFATAASLVGPEKILLGSDYPLVPHRQLAQELYDSGLEPTAQAAILGENAVRLLKLLPP